MAGIALRVDRQINCPVDHAYTGAASCACDPPQRLQGSSSPPAGNCSALMRQRARTVLSAWMAPWTPRQVFKSPSLITDTVSRPNGSRDVIGGILGLAGMTNAVLALARCCKASVIACDFGCAWHCSQTATCEGACRISEGSKQDKDNTCCQFDMPGGN